MVGPHAATLVRRGLAVALVATAATSLSAQQATGSGGDSARAQIQQRRFEFQLMESVLVKAARQGAFETVQRAQMTLPLGTLFVGEAKAKGFPLDGYGLVFDIEIPIILESQVLLTQMAPGGAPVAGPGTRPVSSGSTGTRAAGVVPDDPTDRSPVVADSFLRDPNAFYRNTVRERLVDVMLDYSRSLAVGDAEWLSVVARSEEEPSRSVQSDSRTMILRVKGADLAAFHAGKLTRDEAKKRVIESQF